MEIEQLLVDVYFGSGLYAIINVPPRQSYQFARLFLAVALTNTRNIKVVIMTSNLIVDAMNRRLTMLSPLRRENIWIGYRPTNWNMDVVLIDGEAYAGIDLRSFSFSPHTRIIHLKRNVANPSTHI